MFGQSLLSAFGSAACTTDTDQLFTTDVQTTSLATYQLNNATTSIPSNTYPGTPKNLTYVTGKFGNAGNFVRTGNGDTTSSAIYLPNNSFNSVTSYSLSAWVNLPNFTNSGTAVFSNYFYNGSSEFGYKIYTNTSGNLIIDNWNPSLTRITSSSSLSVNTWHNIVITNTQSQIKIYIDGVLDSTNSTSGYAINTTMLCTIGGTQYNGLTYDGFNGKIDQFRFFNSVLPQSAVTVLYNETTTTATYPYVDYVGANPNSVAYYKMSDATDQLGNYNGTATNVNFNTEGKFGFAGAFNGSSSKILLGTDIFNSFSNFSFSCWVNLNNAPSTYEYLFDGWDYQSASSRGIGIRINSSGNIQAQTGNSNSVSTITSSGTISYGTWTHIAVSMTQSNTTIFINGSTETPQSNNGFDFHTGTTYNLGAFIYTTSFYEYFLDGKLDQVRIYDSALSAANVTTLYNEIECPAVAVTNAFNTVLYTGTGSGLSKTGVGFSPDLVWLKNRDSSSNNQLFDSVRGVGKTLYSDGGFPEANNPIDGYLGSFDFDGFSLSSGTRNTNDVSNLGDDYVAWNWKAGGAAVSGTSSHYTNCEISANPDAGFSIVNFTIPGGVIPTTASYNHGLNAAPKLIITKPYNGYYGDTNWHSWAEAITTANYLDLNTAAAAGAAPIFSSVDSSTVKYRFASNNVGANSDVITYNFTDVDGYSRIGSYVGTGATLQTIVTGFRPRFVLIKNTTDGNVWTIGDSVRNPNNPVDKALFPNLANAEYTYPGTPNGISFVSNGFTLNTNQPEFNQSSGGNNNPGTYIFLAIA